MSNQPYIALQPSEAVVVHAASNIYAAYISAGRVEEGHENEWMRRSIREAVAIAQATDEAILSDAEMGSK